MDSLLFVGFVCIGEQRNQTQKSNVQRITYFQYSLYTEISKTTKSIIHKYASFQQSTKINKYTVNKPFEF